MSVLNRFYKNGNDSYFLRCLEGILYKKNNTIYFCDEMDYIIFDYNEIVMPYEGVFDNADIYYEYSRFTYENPGKDFRLILYVEFIKQGEEKKNLRLDSHLFNGLDTSCFSKLKQMFRFIMDNVELQQKIYDIRGDRAERFKIIFDEEETEDENEVQRFYHDGIQSDEPEDEFEETDEERQERYRLDHQESLNTVTEDNDHSSFEFTSLAFDKFWEDNSSNFVDGTFDITYGFLGIEEIKLRKEDVNQQEENKNKIKTFKSETCVICQGNQPNILFCNCGHLCMCNTCFTLYNKNQYPVCKTESTNVREI